MSRKLQIIKKKTALPHRVLLNYRTILVQTMIPSVFHWLLHMSIVSVDIIRLMHQGSHSSAHSMVFLFLFLYKNKDVENISWLCQNQFIIFHSRQLCLLQWSSAKVCDSCSSIQNYKNSITNVLILQKGCGSMFSSIKFFCFQAHTVASILFSILILSYWTQAHPLTFGNTHKYISYRWHWIIRSFEISDLTNGPFNASYGSKSARIYF